MNILLIIHYQSIEKKFNGLNSQIIDSHQLASQKLQTSKIDSYQLASRWKKERKKKTQSKDFVNHKTSIT